MNAGIQDGMSLDSVVQRTLSSRDEWQARCLKVAHDVVTMTDRITKAATTTSSSSLKLFATLR